MSKKVAVLEKRPLSTEKDYSNMIIHLKKIEKKAKKELSFRNNLLNATGMYDTSGNIKKGFK